MALQLPVVVLVTKIDMAPAHILEDSLRRVDRILKLANRKKFSVLSSLDAIAASDAILSGNVSPVFQLSCVTGEGLDLVRTFLKEMALGKGRSMAGTGLRACLGETCTEKEGCEMQLDNIYNVPGVGTVVAGSVFLGTISSGMHLFLGPDELGEFKEIRVGSIHRQCLAVERVYAGQQCTLAIKLLDKRAVVSKQSRIRKGMVLLSAERMEGLKKENGVSSMAIRRFQARVKVLHHTTTILPGYAPILHLGTIRQSAVIEKITLENQEEGGGNVLRTGGSALIDFRFAYRPEFISSGRVLIFREGTTKGVGRVSKLF